MMAKRLVEPGITPLRPVALQRQGTSEFASPVMALPTSMLWCRQAWERRHPRAPRLGSDELELEGSRG